MRFRKKHGARYHIVYGIMYYHLSYTVTWYDVINIYIYIYIKSYVNMGLQALNS